MSERTFREIYWNIGHVSTLLPHLIYTSEIIFCFIKHNHLVVHLNSNLPAPTSKDSFSHLFHSFVLESWLSSRMKKSHQFRVVVKKKDESPSQLFSITSLILIECLMKWIISWTFGDQRFALSADHAFNFNCFESCLTSVSSNPVDSINVPTMTCPRRCLNRRRQTLHDLMETMAIKRRQRDYKIFFHRPYSQTRRHQP